jgi:hypothetical protein
LVALASTCALFGTLTIAPATSDAHWRRSFAAVCLNVTDNGNSVLTLTVSHRYMLEPDRDDLRTVKALVNGSEPALGAAVRTGPDTVLVNLNGTVAGFFSALQINWNSATGSGTGRVLGELTAHAQVQVTEFRCP